MPTLHEIKEHIGSVNSTKKITRAMYLISASKSQKAKSQLNATLPYFQQIIVTMREILAANGDDIITPFIRHDTGEKNAQKPALYLVLGGDKGMAGGYNLNIIDMLEQHANKARDEVWVAGQSTRGRVQRLGWRVDEAFDYPVMDPSIYRAREVAEMVVARFLGGRYHTVQLVYTEMLSAVRLDPNIMQLLPLDLRPLQGANKAAKKLAEEIEYLSSATEVFDKLVPYYLKGILYSAFVESFASEQNARMYAMDNATKNADETIGRLSIEYNQARQSKITQELTEIIAGIPQT